MPAWTPILLDVRDALPDVELFRLSYKLNEQRAAHTVIDNALSWSRLLTTGTVASQKDLRSLTGKSMATISKTLQILELPAEVLKVVKSQPDRFTLKLGYALVLICRVGETAQAERLAARAIDEELSTADMDKAVSKARMGMRVRKHRNHGEEFHVHGASCVGTIKSWPSGRVSVDLSFVKPLSADEFVQHLRHFVLTSD